MKDVKLIINIKMLINYCQLQFLTQISSKFKWFEHCNMCSSFTLTLGLQKECLEKKRTT